MKQFVVIGLGTFGFNLAIELAKNGHGVLAIDNDRHIVDRIKDHVTDAVVGDAKDKDMLSEFVKDTIDTAILGLGEIFMEETVLAIIHLRDLGVKNIIVKSMNDLRGEVYLSVGATEIIYPEKETAVRLAKRLTIPMLIDQISLAPEYGIVEIALPDSLVGKSIKELKLREKFGVIIIAVKDILRDEMNLIPQPNLILKPDVALILLGKHADIHKLKKFT